MLLISTLFLCLTTYCIGGEVTPYGYHNKVGIHQAAVVKRSEFSSTLLRIVGGSQVAAISTLPYQAGIVVTLSNKGTSICGGSILSNTRVLTAAHCWWDGESQATLFEVVLGSLTVFTGGTRVQTKDIVVHSSWNPKDITNDIAIARIASVTFNNNIQAIALPTSQIRDYAGLTGTVSGYGKTSDSQITFPQTTSLYQASLTILTNAVCQNSFSFKIDTSHLCTSGQRGVGTCDGDSGGPLVIVENNQRILVGVVSFGLSDGCQAGLPSVFTRVTSFLTWIRANL